MAKHHTKAVAKRLIKQHRPRIIKPEALCIGPTKTGTTWLFNNLRQHPQIWVPPVKELEFLSEGCIVPRHSIINLLFSASYRRMRMRLKEKIKRCFSPYHQDQFFDKQTQWLLNYTFGKRSYEWYSGLFPVTPRLCIDITPSYYYLPERRIKEHKAYNPKTKIIIIIRNPIERVWSHARMIFCKDKGRSLDKVGQTEFINLFDNVYQHWLPYSQTIALWQTYFDDVCVEFYDRLNESPTTFFRNICTFLGIDETVVPRNLNQRVNEGLRETVPLAFRQYLYNQYAPEMNALADNGIGYARQWLEEHHMLTNRDLPIVKCSEGN